MASIVADIREHAARSISTVAAAAADALGDAPAALTAAEV